MIYSRSFLMFFFLDLVIFIGYLRYHENDAFILSILFSLLLLTLVDFPLLWLIVQYGTYFFTYLIFYQKKQKMLSLFITEKAFFTSLFYFFYLDYFENLAYSFLVLLACVLFFRLLLVVMFRLLKLGNVDLSLDYMETEKSIFKITHEIKNPIAVCKGYLDMLDVHDEDKVSRYIPIIRSEIDRTLTLMDDFMSMKNIHIRKDILDLYLLIEDVYDVMLPVLKQHKVKLIIPHYQDELYMMGDYDRLKQVLINLIKNAYEAKATKIEIRTHCFSKRVKIEVVDNGVGISKENLKRVGEIFYSTKPKGTGIGVNLSKEIIGLHKGDIRYQSSGKKGTLVTIILPLK
ncbi:MAG TPA: HAMP domain-containing histidine kinase [Candidatus Scybalousia intestinigallinarum]|nr:HAMP domain-containing histidine kinase [Candidatus Scybalousia intestinigallinarum]